MLVIAILLATLAFARLATLNLRGGKLAFQVFATVSLWVVIAFRDFGFGPDTTGYIARYESLQYDSLAEVASRILDSSEKDPIFYLVAKIISDFGASPRMWLAILAAVFSISLGYAVYRYSPEPFLSYVVVVSLGFLYFSMTGLRQTLAMSVLLWSYGALRDRRPVRFLLLVVLASAFHSAALVFVLAYPTAKWRLGWRQVTIVVVALLAAFAAEDVVRQLVLDLAWTEQLAGYSDRTTALSLSGFVISLFVVLFCLAFKSQTLQEDPKGLAFYNLLILGTAFWATAIVIAEMFRLAYMFNLASVLVIPLAIVAGTVRRQREIVYLVVLSSLLGYSAWSHSFTGLSLEF